MDKRFLKDLEKVVAFTAKQNEDIQQTVNILKGAGFKYDVYKILCEIEESDKEES